MTLHKNGRRTPDPRSCVAHLAALHILGCCSEADTHVFAESTLRCCYFHAGCASWRTRAGVGGGPATLKPTPTTQTEPFNCQYTRPDRTTNSSLSGHRSPAKYWVKVAYLETYLRKPRSTASSTRHDSRRVRHSSLQVALEDIGSAQRVKACMIATSPATMHLRPVLLQGSIACSTLSVASSAEEP